jgi:23S rRNA (cytidine2498-2'-O)-methyltransferase
VALAPVVGRRVWTCRAGFEAHLFEELAWSGGRPRLLGAALVEASAAKSAPAFGRMGFEVTAVFESSPTPLDVSRLWG